MIHIKYLVVFSFIITLFTYSSESLAEPFTLHSDGTQLPVIIDFPRTPATNKIPHPTLPGAYIHFFTVENESTSIGYTATLINFPKELGTIPDETAVMMINEALDSQINTVDEALGIKGVIHKNDLSPFEGYFSKYLEIIRPTDPQLFGIYRATFAARWLIIVFSHGLDTTDNRRKMSSFVDSLSLNVK